MSVVPDTLPLLVLVGIGGGEVKSIMDLVRIVQARLGLVLFTRLQGNGRSAQRKESNKKGLGGNHFDGLGWKVIVELNL